MLLHSSSTVYYYNCKVFGLRSYDEHRYLRRTQYQKKVDEQGRVSLEYSDFGCKTNRGGLKHMKVDNKVIRQYENPSDGEHCVVNIFVYYLTLIPGNDDKFYYRALEADDLVSSLWEEINYSRYVQKGRNRRSEDWSFRESNLCYLPLSPKL